MERSPLPEWTETTPHPERPVLSEAELPIGGDAIDRLLAAAGAITLAGLLVRAFIPA